MIQPEHRKPVLTRVGTCVAQRERGQLDMAAGNHVRLMHHDSLTSVRAALVSNHLDAILVSIDSVCTPDVVALASLSRDFPATPIIGMCTGDTELVRRVHALGHAGVSSVVDVRTAAGWPLMRQALAGLRSIDLVIASAIRELCGISADGSHTRTYGWSRFIVACFAQPTPSACKVAATLGIHFGTLNSRFLRVQLPSPKRYLTYAGLVHAVRLGDTGMSVAAIADRLGASSPQSFNRSVRCATGETAGRFLGRMNAEAMLEKVSVDLIDPFAGSLRSFDPLSRVQPRVESAAARFATRREGYLRASAPAVVV